MNELHKKETLWTKLYRCQWDSVLEGTINWYWACVCIASNVKRVKRENLQRKKSNTYARVSIESLCYGNVCALSCACQCMRDNYGSPTEFVSWDNLFDLCRIARNVRKSVALDKNIYKNICVLWKIGKISNKIIYNRW